MDRIRLFSAALATAHIFAFHGMGQPLQPENICSTAPVTVILPNGRLISPAGDWIEVAPFPFSLTMRPDGQQLVAPSLGFPFALNLINHPANSNRRVAQIPHGFLSKPGVEVYTGVAYSPDGKLLYFSTGDSGAVDIVATKDWHRIARIDLNGTLGGHNYKESFAAALVLSATGSKLYVIDEANWRIVVH